MPKSVVHGAASGRRAAANSSAKIRGCPFTLTIQRWKGNTDPPERGVPLRSFGGLIQIYSSVEIKFKKICVLARSIFLFEIGYLNHRLRSNENLLIKKI